MILSFEPVTHTYAVDGVPYHAVTSLLRAFGIVDYSAIPAPILEEARYRGTVVHQALHYWNEGDLDAEQFAADFPAYVGYLAGWQAFCQQRTFTAHHCEYRVAAPSLGVAGTIDVLGELDGRGVLLDFATGTPADAAKDLQTAAYLLLAYEWRQHDDALDQYLTQFPSVARYAVALRKDGTFHLERYPDPRDLRAFSTLAEARRIIDRHARAARPLALIGGIS